jgi:cyclomaltodextrinase
MVEEHNPEFNDIGEIQKIEFLEGDVHLGFYDIRFDIDDKKFFNISNDGVVKIRIHTEPGIEKLWVLFEDPNFRPLELVKYAKTQRFDYWRAHINTFQDDFKFSFAAKTNENLGIYFGTSGVANFISPSEKWHINKLNFKRHFVPDWVFGGVMYQIFPERFYNSNSDLNPETVVPWGSESKRLEFQGGDLYGVIEKLDYIKNLGVNILYLNPIFLSKSVHKYDTWDHFKVDSHLGGDEALSKLVAEVHKRDMKIILDCSLNHVHPRNFAFQDVVKNGESSKYSDWFTVSSYPLRLIHRPHLYSNTYKVGWDGNQEEYKEYIVKTIEETKLPVEELNDDGPIIEPTYKAWWGVPDMPKVNMESEGAIEWGLEVAEYWIKNFNIDGWRMDVAKEISIPFWKKFRNIVKNQKEDSILISEIFGDTSQWLQGDMFDGTMNYSFRELMTDYFASNRISTKYFNESLAHLYSMYSFEAISSCQNLLSSHDVKRFLNRCDDWKDIKGAVFLQSTFPGIASIYYGDEVGLSGGADPNNREPFPWHDEESWNHKLLDYTSELMNLKKTNKILKYGSFELIDHDYDLIIFRRKLKGESLICIFNKFDMVENISLSSIAHKITQIYGKNAIQLLDNSIEIESIEKYSGLIIHEQ